MCPFQVSCGTLYLCSRAFTRELMGYGKRSGSSHVAFGVRLIPATLLCFPLFPYNEGRKPT